MVGWSGDQKQQLHHYHISCEGNPHPLNNFTSERVEEIHSRKPPIGEFPSLKEYWDQTYWLQVRSRTQPARTLMYGPDPSMYQSLGCSLNLLWTRGGGDIKRGKGRKAEVGVQETTWHGLREHRDTSPKPTWNLKRKREDMVKDCCFKNTYLFRRIV